MKMKILWGRKPTDPDWCETVITEHEDRFEAAKAWARTQGYTIFREAEIDPSAPPDFSKTIAAR